MSKVEVGYENLDEKAARLEEMFMKREEFMDEREAALDARELKVREREENVEFEWREVASYRDDIMDRREVVTQREETFKKRQGEFSIIEEQAKNTILLKKYKRLFEEHKELKKKLEATKKLENKFKYLERWEQSIKIHQENTSARLVIIHRKEEDLKLRYNRLKCQELELMEREHRVNSDTSRLLDELTQADNLNAEMMEEHRKWAERNNIREDQTKKRKLFS